MVGKFVSGAVAATIAVVGVSGCSRHETQNNQTPVSQNSQTTVSQTVSSSAGPQTRHSEKKATLEKFTGKECADIISDISTLQRLKNHSPQWMNYDDPVEFERYIRKRRVDLSNPVEHKWFYKAKPDPFSASLHRQVKKLCPIDMYEKMIALKKTHYRDFVWKA